MGREDPPCLWKNFRPGANQTDCEGKNHEIKALADLARGRMSAVRSWAVIDLALSAGLRISEISELRLEDLSLSGSEPRIRAVNGLWEDRKE